MKAGGECVQSVLDLLNIASPTGSEANAFQHIKSALQKAPLPLQLLTHHYSLIATPSSLDAQKKHLVFVGHTDVVPEFFTPIQKDGKLYGAGASDMKGSLGVYLQLIADLGATLWRKYNVSFVFYEKEEQTPMLENGLHALIQNFPQFFASIDLAIVGEPTDLHLHLGCAGSLHAEFTVQGKACHSARPWQGENAIHKALPILDALAKIEHKPHDVFGVTFFDVVQVTELKAEPGRTSLPGWVQGNVNFRFAPVYSDADAKIVLANHLQRAGLKPDAYRFLDVASAGRVIVNDLFTEVVACLRQPLKAKQAWTDVAQLTALNIAAINFGAGLTEQAHQKNEFVPIENLQTYYRLLKTLLVGESQ